MEIKFNEAKTVRPNHLERCLCYDKFLQSYCCYVYDDISKYWCTQGTTEHDPNGDNHIVDYADYQVTKWASLQQESDRLRYCIEYINPQHPLLDNGELNIRHLRVPDEHGAEMALTLMLSLGAKIYALYRGNVIDGKLGEWSTPMIVDADDWYSASWLHDILDCGYTL